MKTYKVEITETLQRVVEISADSQEAAVELVKKQYKDCDIVLDAEDYVATDVNLVN